MQSRQQWTGEVQSSERQSQASGVYGQPEMEEGSRWLSRADLEQAATVLQHDQQVLGARVGEVTTRMLELSMVAEQGAVHAQQTRGALETVRTATGQALQQLDE